MKIQLENPRLRYLAALELLAVRDSKYRYQNAYSRRAMYRRAAKIAADRAQEAWSANLCKDSREMSVVSDAILKASYNIDSID